jgi:hypothetical protein
MLKIGTGCMAFFSHRPYSSLHSAYWLTATNEVCGYHLPFGPKYTFGYPLFTLSSLRFQEEYLRLRVSFIIFSNE